MILENTGRAQEIINSPPEKPAELEAAIQKKEESERALDCAYSRAFVKEKTDRNTKTKTIELLVTDVVGLPSPTAWKERMASPSCYVFFIECPSDCEAPSEPTKGQV